jgi:hypothetical protein
MTAPNPHCLAGDDVRIACGLTLSSIPSSEASLTGSPSFNRYVFIEKLSKKLVVAGKR